MSGLWAQGSYGLDILRYTETLSAVTHVAAERGPARPRLLVLLRAGQARPLDRGERRLHAAAVLHPGQLRDRGARDAVGRVRAVAPPRVLHPGDVRRCDRRGRRAPYRQPDAVRPGLQAARNGVDGRVRAAEHRPGDAARRARARGVARRGCQRRSGVAHRTGHRDRALVIAAAVGALVIVNLPALWNGTFYGKNLQRPEEVPQYWKDAAAYLDAQPARHARARASRARTSRRTGGGTRSIPSRPGSWTDRTSRELIPYGSPASANLLNAFDLRIQDRQLPSDAIAPMARR